MGEWGDGEELLCLDLRVRAVLESLVQRAGTGGCLLGFDLE